MTHNVGMVGVAPTVVISSVEPKLVVVDALGQESPIRPPEVLKDEVKARQLPDPAGFKIFCGVPEFGTKFDQSILDRPDQVVDQERFATVVLFVIKLGPDCYKDKARYPTPWCKEGDFVIVKQYSGTRLRIHGKEFRFIYEDQVEGTVQDPRGISRI